MKRFKLRVLVLVSAVCLALAMSGGSAFAKKKGSSGSNSKKQTQNSNNNQQTAPPTTSPADSDPDVQKAQADMRAAESRVKGTFEATPGWTDAQAAVLKAQADYDDASAPVVSALKSKQEYKDASAKLDAAEAKLTELRNSGSGTPAQISDAAADAMAARSALRSMETDASTGDPRVVAAKATLTAALATVAQLHDKEVAAVSADPAWQDAKKRFDDARARLASAQK